MGLEYPKFEWFMMILIVVSSLVLALDNPLYDPKSKMSKDIAQVDVVLTVAFTFEAVAKIISYGFLNCGSTSYIRNPWNALDFFVVLVTVRLYFHQNFLVVALLSSQLRVL